MIIEHEVEVKWHGMSRRHYEGLGYVYTKKDDKFIVKSTELSDGSNLIVNYKCDYCGVEGKRRYGDIIENRKIVQKDCCPNCAKYKHNEVLIAKQGSLLEKYPKIAKEWSPENIYKNNSVTPYSGKKVKWVCEEGHKWEATIYSRTLEGGGCPICKESKGEQAISNELDKLRINYEREVSFEDLTGLGGGLLRFDFAIFNSSGEMKALIEYDGVFHFGMVFEGDNHKATLIHDDIKNKYCEINKIPLYRIPYPEFERIPEKIREIVGKEIE